jgi:RNA polymerase sigma-70 factor (ECF subfamily)
MNDTARKLVKRAQAKDAEAFAELVRMYQRMSLSVAYGVIHDATVARDVSQDAFIRAWQRLHDLRDPERFGTWLCGIVRNLAVDRLRRRRATVRLRNTSLPHEDRFTHDPVDDVCRREFRERIAGAVADLDEPARAALTMRYYEQLPSKQIGRRLGISADAVDMRLIRARRRLRAALPEFADA